MMRTLNVLLIGGMLAGAGVVYQLKYEAERASAKVGKLTRKIEQEREQIAGLRAEWSLLNQPRRLQELAERYHTYLELERLDPTQVAMLDDIPMRAVSAAPIDPKTPPKPIVQVVKPGQTTGSIPKAGDRVPKADQKVDPKAAAAKPLVIVPKSLDPRPNDPLTNMLR